MEQHHQNSSASYLYKLRTTFTIDPHNFWAQLGAEEQLKEFEKFERLIHEHCKKQPRSSDAEVRQHSTKTTDQVVFVESPKQEKWLRGEIVRIAGDMLDMFYPDYGTTELVPCRCVRLNVPVQFKTEIHHAMRCQLFGIQPISKSWTSRAVKCFNKLTENKTLDALMISNVYGTVHVALYAGEELDHRSVTHILLEEEVGLPWCVENVPEYLYMISPVSIEKVVETPGAEEEESSSESDSDVSHSASSPSLTSPPDEAPRIPSFDTTAIETSHGVTLEMLKISAVMETQKNNRSVFKQQLKEVKSESLAQVALILGPTHEEEEVTVTDDVVSEIHDQIREAESSADTDTEGQPSLKANPTDAAVNKSKISSAGNVAGRIDHRLSRSPHSPSTGQGRQQDISRSASNSPSVGDAAVNKSKISSAGNVAGRIDYRLSRSPHSPFTGQGRQQDLPRSASNSPSVGEIQNRRSCTDDSARQSPSVGRGRGRNVNRSASNSPLFGESSSDKPRVEGKPGVTDQRRKSSPSLGRGRARNRNRSSSNSPLPPGGNGNQRSQEDVKHSEENRNIRSPRQKTNFKQDLPNGGTNKDTTWPRGQMSPREFSRRISTILNLIEKEGLEKHKEDFEELVGSGNQTNHVSGVIEAVLEKAIRYYDSFSSVALEILSLCQSYGEYGESLSSVLYKLQSKYVRVHPKQVYYYESYSHILGQLFVSSASWTDSLSLPLRLCVVNTLQKWIVFNKKKNQIQAEPLQQLYIKSFVELWGRVQSVLQSTMTAEWELIVEDIKEKIESEFTSRSVRHELLNLLLSSVKLSGKQGKKKAVSDAECQTSWKSCHNTTQTPVCSHQHVSCQANLITDTNVTTKPALLLTPEALVKGDGLQSPDQFVVPKFTMPISPDILQGDVRLSPLPVTYSRPVVANETIHSESAVQGVRGRGRGITSTNNVTKPFFTLSGLPTEITTHQPGKADVKVNKAVLPPQLMTPDVFSASVSSTSLTNPEYETNKCIERDSDIPSTRIFGGTYESNFKQNEYEIPHSETNANNSNMAVTKAQAIESEVKQSIETLNKSVPTAKKKKKQLLDLNTGKVIVGEPVNVPKSENESKEPPASSTFSYAAALSTTKPGIEDKAKSKPSLSIKSIAMDLLREPTDRSPSPETLPAAPKSTEPQHAAPWGKVTPTRDWAVDNAEFPSLQEAESLKQQKVKTVVAVEETNPDTTAASSSEQSSRSQYAFSDDDNSDSEDEWFTGTGIAADNSVQKYCTAEAAQPKQNKPAWKPGVRKCLICGDVNHLIHDCPNKNKGFFL